MPLPLDSDPTGSLPAEHEPGSVPRDFATMLRRQFTDMTRGRRWFWPLIAVTLLLGAALGLVLPSSSLVFVVTAVALLGLSALMLRTDRASRQQVDWDTADTYKASLIAELPARVLQVLAEVETIVGANADAPAVHLLRLSGTDDHPGRVCGPACQHCQVVGLTGCVWWSPTHPVVMLGDRLLSDAGLLRFVAGHEVRHTGRFMRRSFYIRHTLMTFGWFALGLTTPPELLPVTAPILLAGLIAWSWGEELACDIASARHPDADAAGWYAAWAIRGLGPWLLAPTHPPVTLRAAIVTRLADRARRQTRR